MIGWTCCFGPLAKQHTVIRAHGGTKLLTSWPGSERDRAPLQRHAPNNLKTFHQASPLPNSTTLGTQPSTHGPLGDSQDPNFSKNPF